MHSQPDSKLTGPNSSPVFITGATGFIGRRLAASLLQSGYHVRAMVRPDRETDRRLPAGCEPVAVDLGDLDRLQEIVSSSDAVVYCAGSVRGRQYGDFVRANMEGVRAMAQALEKFPGKAPPLLLISSLAAGQPQLSNYARSKQAGEQELQTRPQLDWTILRPPAVYGPGDREVLPLLKMIRRGYAIHPGPREQRLSLLHVDDLVRAISAWLKAPQQCLGKTFAIDDGTPDGYDWPQIAEAAGPGSVRLVHLPRALLHIIAGCNQLLSKVIGYPPMLTPGKVRELVYPRWLCDNSGFSAATGWQPRLDLSRGVRQLFAAGVDPSAG